MSKSFTLLALLSLAAPQVPPQQAPDRPAPSPPPITFGVEVRYVEVDAIVTDRDGNAVRDLTRDDFEILEEGKPQKVELAALVDLELPPIGKQTPRPVEPDVKNNAKPFEGRLYVIVLDDYHTAALRSGGVKQAARRFIEQYMGDEDLAAVIHTSGRGDAAQELTGNRRLLLAAVDKFMGRRLRSSTLNRIDVYNQTREMRQQNERIRDPEEFERGYNARAALDTLKNLADWLANIRGRRKAVLYISEGIDYDIHDAINNQDASTILGNVKDVISAATRGNVSFYTVDPRGLHMMSDELMEMTPVQDTSLGLDIRGLQSEMQLSQDSLRVLAEETVGRAAVATNDFAGAFERLVSDNSTYYVLGYRPPNERHDGRFRKLRVRVKRPDVKVRARAGYVLSQKARRTDTAASEVRAPAELKELLGRPLQQSGLPMAVHAAVFKGTGKKASVMVTVYVSPGSFEYTEKDGKFHETLDVRVVALDHAGKSTGTESQAKLDLRPQTRQLVDLVGFRLLAQLELQPGRYQLRVVGRAVNAAAAGSVYYDLEVPDFSSPPLALSGLALSSAGGATIPTAGSFEPLKGVLPAAPTTFREFYALDTLAVVAEVYDNELKMPHTLDITTSVAQEDGTVRFRNEQERKSEELTSIGGGAFVHKALVPLQDLEPGRYTLKVEARSRMGKRPAAAREVEFRVLPPRQAGG